MESTVRKVKNIEPMNEKNIVFCNDSEMSIVFMKKKYYNLVIQLLSSNEAKLGYYLVER